jgi:membrane protein
MTTESDQPTIEIPRLTVRGLIHYMYRHWHDDRVSGLAAEIGFFALLSLFPLLLVLSAALGWLSEVIGSDLATDVEGQLADWSETIFGEGSSVTSAIRELFAASSASALTVGVIATLYTASRGFAAVVRALDVAYGHHETRGWVGTQVIGFLLSIGSILVGSLTLAGLVIGPLFGREDFVGNGAVGNIVEFLWIWLRFPVAAMVLVLWAATVMHLAPNRRASWRWELPGAFFAALLWLIATALFGWYVQSLSSSSNPGFGVIGTAITLQLWLFLLAIGLVLGAELNGALAIRRGPAANWTQPQFFTRVYRGTKRLLARR